MEMLNKDESLAQIHDLRRRLKERDFSDVPSDEDDTDAEIVDLADQRKEQYASSHPTMIQRSNTDG